MNAHDLYGEFTLATATIAVARAEDARLTTRLADAELCYEINVALLAFRCTTVSLLFVLNMSWDPEGEAFAEWTQECAMTWSVAEAEAVYEPSRLTTVRCHQGCHEPVKERAGSGEEVRTVKPEYVGDRHPAPQPTRNLRWRMKRSALGSWAL